jgi:general secretion pathway protein F
MTAVPNYFYKAVTRDGEADEGQMFGDNAAAVIARLQDSGRIPISAEEIREGGARRARAGRRRLLKRASGRADIAGFTQSLASLVSSSIPLDRALQIMLDAQDDPATRKLVGDVQASVRGGNALSTALEEQGAMFSRFHISMIRAAEASGTLGEGLTRLTGYLERARMLRDKVRSALIYPGILACVAGLSVIILLVYVVPQFRPIFDEMGSSLPLATRVTLAISDFFAAWGWLVAAALGLSAIVIRRLWMQSEFRRRVDGVSLRLGRVGVLIQAVDTARFSRSLGTLLQNGVPLLSGLPIARDTMANSEMARAVSDATEDLREGGDLSAALQKSGVFPSLAIQMLMVGEESGTVDAMMLRMSDAFDREVETSIQRLLMLLEPALIVGLGIVIAGIIMSVLIGIISINDLPV